MASDKNYEINLYWSQEDSAFIAEVPELPGCAADGSTYQEALATPKLSSANGSKPRRNWGGSSRHREAVSCSRRPDLPDHFRPELQRVFEDCSGAPSVQMNASRLGTGVSTVEFDGEFETHIALRAEDDSLVESAQRWASVHGLKFLHIVLERGQTPSQPMITRRASGTLSAQLKTAHDLTARMAVEGITVSRIKIEAAPRNRDVPDTDDEARKHASRASRCWPGTTSKSIAVFSSVAGAMILVLWLPRLRPRPGFRPSVRPRGAFFAGLRRRERGPQAFSQVVLRRVRARPTWSQ